MPCIDTDTNTAADCQLQSNPTPTPEAVTGILLGICGVMLMDRRVQFINNFAVIFALKTSKS